MAEKLDFFKHILPYYYDIEQKSKETGIHYGNLAFMYYFIEHLEQQGYTIVKFPIPFVKESK